MKTFQDMLADLDTCKDAREWAGDMVIEQFVATCHRGDWLLRLAEEVGVEKRLIVLAGGLCANKVREFMLDERSKNATDVCIRYGTNDATDKELAAAYADAVAAARAPAGTAAETAAGTAAWAAAATAAEAAQAAAWAAAATAAGTVRVAAEAAGAAAWAVADARAASQRQTADIAREVCGNQIIELVNQLIK